MSIVLSIALNVAHTLDTPIFQLPIGSGSYILLSRNKCQMITFVSPFNSEWFECQRFFKHNVVILINLFCK